MDIREFEKELHSFKNKKIAIVYTYQAENEIGFEHYDFWKMDVVTAWLNAIEKIGAIPYILDVRTFCEKSLINTLPKIDFVINLNAGNTLVSTWGLVPSVCSFKNIPCLPCSTYQAVTGEHKHYTNLIAKAVGLKIPDYLPVSSPKLSIKRPLTLGSSNGVKHGHFDSIEDNEILQEFIQGFDLTIPIIYNPLKGILEVLPSILYSAFKPDLNWYHGEESKKERNSYNKYTTTLQNDAKNKILEFVNNFDINTYCRVDVRIHAKDIKELEELITQPIPLKNIYFLELNAMPTIKYGINFLQSLEEATKNELKDLYDIYSKIIQDNKSVDLLLTCALFGTLKPSIKNSRI